MADRIHGLNRRLNALSLGGPGRLTYSTYTTNQNEDSTWHTARVHDANVPRFRIVGPFREWSLKSQNSSVAAATWVGNSIHKQRRWLLKAHPEATLGNCVLHDLLSAEASDGIDDSPSNRMAQLAIGEMTDISDPKAISVAPLIATVGGPTGNILRLVRPSTEPCSLGPDHDATFQLRGDTGLEEALWTEDTGTIRRIKAVISTRRFEPIRWIIVQRDWSTSVFRPEYQTVPMVPTSAGADGRQYPSRIAPNLLLTISKHRTGHEAQSDASFNPGIKSRLPQLAIIDEGGNWTIWAIGGTRKRAYRRPKVVLEARGSIRDGSGISPSYRNVRDGQWHRALFVGMSVDARDEYAGSDDEDATTQSSTSFPALHRCSNLLLCNRKIARFIDLETKSFLPDISFVADDGRGDILDVQVVVEDPRYFFVVTSTKLFVVAVLSRDDSMHEVSRQVTILCSFRHMRDKYDRSLRLCVAPGPRSSGWRTSLVFLYSEGNPWVDVTYVNFSRKHAERVTCHRNMVVLKQLLNSSADFALQTLHILPVPLPPSLGPKPSLQGHQYMDSGTLLYQVFLLSHDAKLVSTAGSSSAHMDDQSLLPITRDDTSTSQLVQRRKVIRYLSSRFVVPDSLAEIVRGPAGAVTSEPASVDAPDQVLLRRVLGMACKRIVKVLQELVTVGEGHSLDMEIRGAAPFDPLYVAVEAALQERTFPVRVVHEIVRNVKIPEDLEEASSEWQTEIEQLHNVDPALQLTALGASQPSIDQQPLHELVSRLERLTVANAASALVSRRIACELFLSLFGMMYRKEEIFNPEPPAPLESQRPMTPIDEAVMSSPGSSRPTLFDDNNRPAYLESQGSSRPSTPTSSVSSEPTPSEAAEEAESTAIAILREYTGSGGCLPGKNLDLLSTWTIGEDPESHTYSLDREVEITEGMQRRARQEAREARKRKRRETLLEQVKEQRVMPATQPAPETRFSSQASQPSASDFYSSQAIPSSSFAPPPIAMSQPVAGAFGQRVPFERPKKRPKRRKGGF